MWPALLVIAASMFAKHMANQQAQNRSSSLQQAMETYQRTKAQQNEGAINQLVSQQTPDARAKELQDINASRSATMNQTVDQARAASPIQPVAGTNTSPDYQQAAAAAADRVSTRTANAIKNLSTMGAPGEQAISSGVRFGRAAGNVDAGNAAIGNVGAGYMRDINNVRPNPMLSMLGDVGMAVGGGMAGSALGAAGGAAAANASANSGQGFEDASGNLYNENVTNAQDARISRQLAMRRAMAQWGQ